MLPGVRLNEKDAALREQKAPPDSLICESITPIGPDPLISDGPAAKGEAPHQVFRSAGHDGIRLA